MVALPLPDASPGHFSLQRFSVAGSFVTLTQHSRQRELITTVRAVITGVRELHGTSCGTLDINRIRRTDPTLYHAAMEK